MSDPIKLRDALIFLTLATGAVLVQSRADVIDPTRPPITNVAVTERASEIPAPQVSAIFYSGDRRVAVVDGRTVCEGEVVNGATVSAIMADGIRYSRAGRTGVARLQTQSMRVRSVPAQESGQ